MKLKALAFAIGGFLTAAAAPLSAATLYDTGAGNSNVFLNVGDDQSLAGRIFINERTTITGVEGFLYSNGDITIGLYGDYDDTGVSPGASIYETTFTASSQTSWQGASNLNWTVDQGIYWVTYSGTGSGGMSDGAPEPLGRYAFKLAGESQTWNRTGEGLGVRVYGNAAPGAPAPALGLGLLPALAGAGALAATRRRRKPQAA